MAYPDELNLTQLATLKNQQLDPPPIGAITSIAVTNGGSGYTSLPAVVISAPTPPLGSPGTQAVATAVISGGAVVGVNVTTPGQGYTAPTIGFSGGGGTGAVATANVGSDTALSRLISAASAVIIGALNIPTVFDPGTNMTERRNGNGGDRMVTKVSPIISITSLTIDGVAIPASDGTSAGYLFDDHLVYLIGYTFTRGIQNVTLVYRAGVVAGSVTQLALEQACLVTCALWWKRRAHIDQASMSTPSGLGSINFTQKDLPPEAWTVINDLKRVVPVTP